MIRHMQNKGSLKLQTGCLFSVAEFKGYETREEGKEEKQAERGKSYNSRSLIFGVPISPTAYT